MPTTAEPTARLRVEGDTVQVSGELGFATVETVLAAGRAAVGGVAAARVVLDLGGVTKSDSAGLALLLDWLREAETRGKQVEVRGVPPQLAEIARLGGLQALIGLEESADAA